MNAFSSPTWLSAAINYAGNKHIKTMELDTQERLKDMELIWKSKENAYDRANKLLTTEKSNEGRVEAAEVKAEGGIKSAAINAFSNITRDGWKYFVGPALMNGRNTGNPDNNKKNNQGPKPPTNSSTPISVEIVDNSKARARAEAEKKWKELFPNDREQLPDFVNLNFNPYQTDHKAVMDWKKLAIPALVLNGSALLSPMYVL